MNVSALSYLPMQTDMAACGRAATRVAVVVVAHPRRRDSTALCVATGVSARSAARSLARSPANVHSVGGRMPSGVTCAVNRASVVDCEGGTRREAGSVSRTAETMWMSGAEVGGWVVSCPSGLRGSTGPVGEVSCILGV